MEAKVAWKHHLSFNRLHKVIFQNLCNGFDSWYFALREEHELKVFENSAEENIWTKEGGSDRR
jgi:hypothetical protein